MEASVKIMLSYDYNHFEICLSSECETKKEVNELRKTAQRLADEAVRQYKVATAMESKRYNAEMWKQEYQADIKRIKEKPEGERTINEIAKLKVYENGKWEKQFDCDYDYDDDDDFNLD